MSKVKPVCHNQFWADVIAAMSKRFEAERFSFGGIVWAAIPAAATRLQS